jgi:hypothetical protein
MLEINSLAQKIFSLLKGNGLQIKIFDEEGAETTNPELGRRFFVMSPNVMVTVDEAGKNIEFSKGANVGDEVDALQKGIRRLADEFMVNSNIKVFGKSIQPKDFAYQAKIKKAENTSMMENFDQVQYKKYENAILSELKLVAALSVNALLNTVSPYPHQHEYIVQVLNKLRKDGFIETVGQGQDNTPLVSLTKKGLQVTETLRESFSKMFGSLKTSRQVLENVRIIVRHKAPVDESKPGARSRHISAIFLESNGERFRFPHNYLPGARAMAQHMAHGGTMGDKVGTHITESTSQLLKLQSFNRYVTNNKLINEDSSGIVDTVKETIETLRTELKKLTGVKTYETVKARIETFERESLAEDDVTQLKDLFTIRKFDEKFEEVLPIVKQLIQEKDTFHKRIEEAAAQCVRIKREAINTTPILEFSSENARIGYKISELSTRILENQELSSFINKLGSKLIKEGKLNDFEKAVLTQVFENMSIVDKSDNTGGESVIKESLDLESYFDKYLYKFF